jgi:hypothetical protein
VWRHVVARARELLDFEPVKPWIAVVFVAACGGLDTDIESDVTISMGAYGLVLDSNDNLGVGVGITVEEPPLPGQAHGASLDAATTDANGVYQFELPAGTYQLCTGSCLLIDVPDEHRVRRDWINGANGGSWCDGRC